MILLTLKKAIHVKKRLEYSHLLYAFLLTNCIWRTWQLTIKNLRFDPFHWPVLIPAVSVCLFNWLVKTSTAGRSQAVRMLTPVLCYKLQALLPFCFQNGPFFSWGRIFYLRQSRAGLQEPISFFYLLLLSLSKCESSSVNEFQEVMSIFFCQWVSILNQRVFEGSNNLISPLPPLN